MASQQLGSGSFGAVVARQLPSGRVVAAKKASGRRPSRREKSEFVGPSDVSPSLLTVPKTAHPADACLREINTLLQIRHPNVVKLLRAEVAGQHVVLICEFCSVDLSKARALLGSLRNQVINGREWPFAESDVLTATHQLLLGVRAIHDARVLHRDLKPHNVLLSPSGALKIADFGLARPVLRPGAPLTPSVATRWYRAPELLFGSGLYGEGVDLWGLACIMAELLGCAPLFPGEDDVDQLQKARCGSSSFRCQIQRLLGTASEASWPGVSSLPDFGKILFREYPSRDLAEVFPDASSRALSVLADILVLDPARRRTAVEVLDRHFQNSPRPLSLAHWLGAAAASSEGSDTP